MWFCMCISYEFNFFVDVFIYFLKLEIISYLGLSCFEQKKGTSHPITPLNECKMSLIGTTFQFTIMMKFVVTSFANQNVT